jgi:signal transduction histidine kinase
VGDATAIQRLLRHAQRLVTLGGADEILGASCREVIELTGAERVFASCCLPRHGWEHGTHIESDHAVTRRAGGPARSALFAVHRRVVGEAKAIEVARTDETASIFAGLGCPDPVATLDAVPLVHRTGRVWGELVLIGAPPTEGVSELAQLATIALENAQRLAFARRDQDRLLLLAEATEDALYDWDFDTREFWWGGGILKLFGSEMEPVENSPRWKHDRIHPDEAGAVLASFDQARATDTARWEREYRFRRHDGSYCDIEDRAYFLRDATGRAYRTIGSMRDVTAHKRLFAREQEARTDAENANRAKDDFLAMLGHELRNPLAPIVSGLELLRARSPHDVDKALPVLQRQAQHLVHLVDDLLDISRIAHGKIQLDRVRVEVAAAVAEAVELASPMIESREHRLSIDVPARGLEVDADPARLAQAIGNLLNNAAKYTEPGGLITVSAERVDGSIAIRVRDTGIGIAPDMLSHVFRMFVQERQTLARTQGGLGLGLSIVRNLVELHGGTVEPASEGRGRGSTFTIRIPAAVPALPAEPAPVVPQAEAPPSGRRIMVVDDNQDAAWLLSELLEEMGNTTRIAHDAHDALRLVEEFGPDLAVLDIGLPIIDGYELARQLRARDGRPALQLIALTGYGSASDKERARLAGFDAHLVKPVAIGALQALIAKLP